MNRSSKNFVRLSVAGVLTLFILIQFVPYGRDHTNPPVIQEPNWVSPEVRELAVKACFDCHSNESEWPWYSNMAPLSWAIQNHVEEGRGHLNFSEWNKEQDDADEAAEQFEKQNMPLLIYLPLHPEAVLEGEERQILLNGLEATFGRKSPDSN